MKNQKGFVGISLLIVTLALASGYAYYKINETPDSDIEEISESIAEEQIENLLGLDDGKLKGKIDLSSGSPEK